jgi:hypothetical protein
MRAEPPEQALNVTPAVPGLDAGDPVVCLPVPDGGIPGLYDTDAGYFADGGLFCVPQSLLADAGIPIGSLGGSKTTKPVTVTALVADPKGAGRAIHYAWSVCALRNSQSRCDADADGYQALDEGDVAQGSVSNEIAVTFTPSTALLNLAVQKDAYRGFGGLPLPVQLRITAGTEVVVGEKLVIFTLPAQMPATGPNQNPVLLDLKASSQSWTADFVAPFKGSGADGGHDLLPVYDPATQVAYTRPTFDGKTIDFTERFKFAWYATGGGFSPAISGGGQQGFNPNTITDDTRWKPDNGDPEQDVTYWVVVRDGRGGENWLLRHGHYTP